MPPETSPTEPELHRRLREAGPEELAALVRQHADELAAPAVRHALRNPYCTVEVIELVAGARRLLSFHEVRRELHLGARLPELAVGEKVTIARRASSGILSQLRHDPNPQVIAALLDNPRLTEGLLAPVLHSAATPPAVLELIAADRRWGVRYPLRVALVRNPATPLKTSWRLLESLRKADLRPVAADPRIPEPVRRRARVLLEQKT